MVVIVVIVIVVHSSSSNPHYVVTYESMRVEDVVSVFLYASTESSRAAYCYMVHSTEYVLMIM
jgi:hypothetical protein